MPTTVVKQMMASVGALSAERRRLEDELLKMENRMTTPAKTDDMIRALKAEVDAEEARLAEKRDLLARAEEQRKTLARDQAAATEAAHREAVAACKSRIAALLDHKLALVAHAERLSRELLDARKEIVAANAEVAAEAGRLTAARAAPSGLDVLKRMSLREAKLIAQMPGGRHRYGHIELPSGSFGLLPDGLTWAEDEERHHGDLRALIEEAS